MRAGCQQPRRAAVPVRQPPTEAALQRGEPGWGYGVRFPLGLEPPQLARESAVSADASPVDNGSTVGRCAARVPRDTARDANQSHPASHDATAANLWYTKVAGRSCSKRRRDFPKPCVAGSNPAGGTTSSKGLRCAPTGRRLLWRVCSRKIVPALSRSSIRSSTWSSTGRTQCLPRRSSRPQPGWRPASSAPLASSTGSTATGCPTPAYRAARRLCHLGVAISVAG